MVNRQWYVILESNEVMKNRVVSMKRLGKNLIAWRESSGKVNVMGDRCPHMGASLSQASHEGNCITCAFHGLQFAGNGECTAVPALGTAGKIPRALHAQTYPTHEQAGLIWIWFDEAGSQPTSQPEFFEALTDDFSYISFQQPWPIHYSRMAENQLDVMHLPFVHATTIGRSGKKVVDGPVVSVENQRINIWVYNRMEDGSPARRGSEMAQPERHPSLQFQFPNLWHNWISDEIRVSAAFVPVDEDNSIFYGRFYQRMTRLPIVKQLYNWSGKIGSQVIANQDRRIVTRILPSASSLKDGDILLQGDRAIVAYRQMRKDLMEPS